MAENKLYTEEELKKWCFEAYWYNDEDRWQLSHKYMEEAFEKWFWQLRFLPEKERVFKSHNLDRDDMLDKAFPNKPKING